MTCRACCRLFVAGLALCVLAGVSTAGESPYARVARGKPTKGSDVKVYTNADLRKLFGIVERKEGQSTEPDSAVAPRNGATSKDDRPDALSWLQQRQTAQAQYGEQLSEARATVEAARARLASLEVQLSASRNPYSARPKLSDEEKEIRRTTHESAAQRNERTKRLVEQAREDLRSAKAALKKLQANRP